MAKCGESDPRWIVEERSDATNVNNWHWTEKNASNWSRDKFKELFIGLKIEGEIGFCKITEITKCGGEAVVNNRKGKLIYFYEWHFEMKWIGVPIYDTQGVEGKVVILNFTEEQDIKDTDITVYCDKQEDYAESLKCVMEKRGKSIILDQLEDYVTQLKEDFSKDLLMPSHLMPLEKKTVEKIFCDYASSAPKYFNYSPEENIEVGDINTTEAFKCTSEELYKALTDRNLMEAFTQSDCLVESVEGGKFEIFNGNVQGRFIKLQPFHTIMLQWRLKSWPNNHLSDTVISIEQKDDYTELKLSQSGIPKEELENTREGWKRHYWDNIKRVFGYGVLMF